METKTPYQRAVEKVLTAGLLHFNGEEAELDECLLDPETVSNAMPDFEPDELAAWQKIHRRESASVGKF